MSLSALFLHPEAFAQLFCNHKDPVSAQLLLTPPSHSFSGGLVALLGPSTNER
jgi:hypothetical protein